MKQSIRDWLTRQFGEDASLIAELYSQYSADMSVGVKALRDFADAGGFAAMASKAHALKGIALMVGDAASAELCLNLERVCKQGDKASLKPALTALSDAVASLGGGYLNEHIRGFGG